MLVDLEPHQIGVSVLCPGLVNTNIFNSDRNRPADLPGTDASTLLVGNLPAEQQAVRLEELRAGALEPAVVGDMVLHAIREQEFYIFTHPELQEMTDLRSNEMAGAYGRWREYREQRGV